MHSLGTAVKPLQNWNPCLTLYLALLHSLWTFIYLVSNSLANGIMRSPKHLAPVVQTLDSAIHWINQYPVDKYYGNQLRYPLDSDLSGG